MLNIIFGVVVIVLLLVNFCSLAVVYEKLDRMSNWLSEKDEAITKKIYEVRLAQNYDKQEYDDYYDILKMQLIAVQNDVEIIRNTLLSPGSDWVPYDSGEPVKEEPKVEVEKKTTTKKKASPKKKAK